MAKLKIMMAHEGLILFSLGVCQDEAAMLAQPNGCSPLGNESIQLNDVTLPVDLCKYLGVGATFVGKRVSVFAHGHDPMLKDCNSILITRETCAISEHLRPELRVQIDFLCCNI